MAKKIEVLTTIPFPEPVMQRLREVSPYLHLIIQPAQKLEDISADQWKEMEILYTDLLVPDPSAVPNLRWIQYHYAGVDFLQGSPLLEKSDLAITTMSGASAIQEGEYILGMMLALGHRMPELFQNQLNHEWPADRWERFAPFELSGTTVGLVGYGSIGREVARLLQPHDVRVLATKKKCHAPGG
jgi:phosphoglycerate dehydrogenase-like enzyme